MDSKFNEKVEPVDRLKLENAKEALDSENAVLISHSEFNSLKKAFGSEKKSIMVPVNAEDLKRIQEYYDQKCIEIGGDKYIRNKAKKAEKRKGMIKVIGHFYNPVQGKNVIQVRWVNEDSISDRGFNEHSESRKLKDKMKNDAEHLKTFAPKEV